MPQTSTPAQTVPAAQSGAIAALAAVQPLIDAPAALRAAQAAVQHATQLGVRINVAVVDACGLTVAFARMAGAPLHSMDIATDKAYTAASFGLPTGQWHEALAAHSEAVRQGLVLRPRFVAFGGGLPITAAQQCLGGIGVSGGSEAQDEAIARAGLGALGLDA